MEMSRDETRALQGIAVILMMVHHLFGLPTLIEPPSGYISTLPGLPLDYLAGRYGKVCVALFLLLSGYGLAKATDLSWRRTGQRLWRFMTTYWVYFALLVGSGALVWGDLMTPRGPRFDLEPGRLLSNALALRHDYAYEWWFAEVYLAMVLLAPILVPLRRFPLPLLIGSVLAFGLGAGLDVMRLRLPVTSPANILIWQLPFVMGLLLAGSGEFARRLPRARVAAAILLVGTLAVEWGLPRAMTPWLIVTVPLSLLVWRGVLARIGGALRDGLAWVGGRALPLWLVHPFLCYYFAQPLVYAPRWAPLVLLLLVGLSLAIVLPVEALRRRLRIGGQGA